MLTIASICVTTCTQSSFSLAPSVLSSEQSTQLEKGWAIPDSCWGGFSFLLTLVLEWDLLRIIDMRDLWGKWNCRLSFCPLLHTARMNPEHDTQTACLFLIIQLLTKASFNSSWMQMYVLNYPPQCLPSKCTREIYFFLTDIRRKSKHFRFEY